MNYISILAFFLRFYLLHKIWTYVKGGRFISFLLFMLGFISPIFSFVPACIVIYCLGIQQHTTSMMSMFEPPPVFIPDYESKEDLNTIHDRYKGYLNALSKDTFFEKKTFGCIERVREVGIVSRAFDKLKNILVRMHINPVKVVDLCAGRGGWTQCCKMLYPQCQVTAISLWEKAPGHEIWSVGNQYGVNRICADIKDIKPFATDMILFDGGGQSSDSKVERDNFFRLFSNVEKWIRANPKANFTMKVLVPGDKRVVGLLNTIRSVTGKGTLERSPYSRISSAELYFTSKKTDQNYSDFIRSHYHWLEQTWEAAKKSEYKASQVRGLVKPIDERPPEPWSKLASLGINVAKLETLDMSESIKELEATYQNPPNKLVRQTTSFLRCLMCWQSDKDKSEGDFYNPFVSSIMHIIKEAIPAMGSWHTTSTDSGSTFSVILKKVDSEPKENHSHYKQLHSAYNALADFCRSRNWLLKRLEDGELGSVLNRVAGVGRQERHLAGSLGELWDNRQLVHQRESKFMHSLRAKKPILGIFNSMGKREKKPMKSKAQGFRGSRLIWFLPGTARIAEARTFGSLQNILKKLPFSVSGLAPYDYGDFLRKKWKKGNKAVADDIAGWDTKISYGDLCLEADFLKKITNDQELKKDIHNFYSLYAHKNVLIKRPARGGTTMDCLFSLRGQRGSGEIVTYGMNTITNACLNYCRMAHSMGIDDVYKFVKEHLERAMNSTAKWDMAISGDDSVVMGPESYIEKFSVKGALFLDQVGKPRKDTPRGVPSPILHHFEDISFCSHQYRKVTCKNVEKYMPVRPLEEIFGKLQLSLVRARSVLEQEGWARSQAFQMLMMYPHIIECRWAACALLSATASNIDWRGMSVESKFRKEPWLRVSSALEALTKVFFPSEKDQVNKIEDISAVRDTPFTLCSIKGLRIRGLWKRRIIPIVQAIRRKRIEEVRSKATYEDALLIMPLFQHLAAETHLVDVSKPIEHYFVMTKPWVTQRAEHEPTEGWFA